MGQPSLAGPAMSARLTEPWLRHDLQDDTSRRADNPAQLDSTDGAYPGPLLQATNGDLYGTTQQGGANKFGTIFKMTPADAPTTLYNFCPQAGCLDGANPSALI